MDPVILAIKDKNLPKVKSRIERDYDVRRDNSYVMKCCAIYGNLEILKYLIEAGYKPQSATKDFTVKWAAIYGRMDMLKYLIEEEKCDRYRAQSYALRHAAANGHVDVVEYLTDGIDSWELELYCYHVLRMASKNGHLKMVNYLINKCCNPNNLNRDRATIWASQWALKYNQSDIALRLACDNNGKIYLESAILETCIIKNKFETLKYFISLGCDPRNSDDYFLSACIFHSRYEIAKFLISFGCNLTKEESHWRHHEGYFPAWYKMYMWNISILTNKELSYCINKNFITDRTVLYSKKKNVFVRRIRDKNNLLKFILRPMSMSMQLSFIQ
jgi:hypothetical protein